MSKGVPVFQKDRLIQAREARGLTAVSLAEIVGIGKAAISKYEGGTMKPTEEGIQALSDALKVPVNFFLKLPHPIDNAPVFYRSRTSATAHARKRSARKFEWLKETSDYLSHYLDFPALNLPPIKLPDDHRNLTKANIESAAHECRQWWGIAPGPMPNLNRLLEKNGFAIGVGKVDADNFDAFCQRRTIDGRPFIFLSTDKSVAARSRFDASHEFGHTVLHRSVDEKTLNSPAELKIIETQANYFASAFLLPEKEFCEELVAPSLDCFRGMKSRWKTSIAAMIMRCASLDIIDEDQTKRLWINLTRSNWRTKEPLDDTMDLEKPTLLSQSVRMIVGEGAVTKQQLLDDLCLPQPDIEELCALPDGYFSEDFGEIISFAKFKTDNKSTDNSPEQTGDGDIIDFPTAS